MMHVPPASASWNVTSHSFPGQYHLAAATAQSPSSRHPARHALDTGISTGAGAASIA